MEIKTLTLEEIRIDGGTQPRVIIDEAAVTEYAETLSSGVTLPPVVVFFDGAVYWLADGFHRYLANKRNECDCIQAEIHEGTKRDAILYSVGANVTHGLRRTNADKRKAVLTLLEDTEWAKWSDREIAKQCIVGNEMVSRTRRSLCDSHSENRTSTPRTYTTKHGTVARMNTSSIGSSGSGASKRRSAQLPRIDKNAFKPVRRGGTVLAQTNLNLPHDSQYGARAIVSAMGEEYAHSLIESLTIYLNNQKEGAA